MSSTEPSAAHRVYHNAVIAKTIVQYLSPTALLSVMIVEQRGDLFDQCVKLLYRKVGDHAIEGKRRDSERHRQYLDAVRVLVHKPRSKTTFGVIVESELSTPDFAQALRVKCPQLQLVKCGKPRLYLTHYEIVFDDLSKPGRLRLHRFQQWSHSQNGLTHFGIKPNPSPTPAGWNVELTATLNLIYARPQGVATVLAALQQPSGFDSCIVDLDLPGVESTLPVWTGVVASRGPGDKRFRAINASVQPFSFNEFIDFGISAGADLVDLQLHITEGVSEIGLGHLADIVTLLRNHCPNLPHLRLPVALDPWREQTDHDIAHPPLSVPLSGGKMQSFTICLSTESCRYYSSRPGALSRLLSYNITLNMACLLGTDGRVHLKDVNSFGHVSKINTAIDFFHRLGPILEPHLRKPSLAHLGVTQLSELNELRYHVNGSPMKLAQSRWITERRRMKALGIPQHMIDIIPGPDRPDILSHPKPEVRDASTQTDENTLPNSCRPALEFVASASDQAQETDARPHKRVRRNDRNENEALMDAC